MSVRYYTDVHVRRAIIVGLRLRGVDVLTAQADGASQFVDPRLLDRATELNRVLFSQDADLLREATARQRQGKSFAGVIYAHQLRVTTGQCLDELELIAKVCESEDLANRVLYLPLR